MPLPLNTSLPASDPVAAARSSKSASSIQGTQLGQPGPQHFYYWQWRISIQCLQVAAFCAETIQGVGGAVPLADGYLPAVYEVSASTGSCRPQDPLLRRCCRAAALSLSLQ